MLFLLVLCVCTYLKCPVCFHFHSASPLVFCALLKCPVRFQLSCVGPLVFWLGNMIWDFLSCALLAILQLIIFVFMKAEDYTGTDQLPLVLLLFLMFGLAMPPFAYLMHFLFKSPATGLVVLMFINILGGKGRRNCMHASTMVNVNPILASC